MNANMNANAADMIIRNDKPLDLSALPTELVNRAMADAERIIADIQAGRKTTEVVLKADGSKSSVAPQKGSIVPKTSLKNKAIPAPLSTLMVYDLYMRKDRRVFGVLDSDLMGQLSGKLVFLSKGDKATAKWAANENDKSKKASEDAHGKVELKHSVDCVNCGNSTKAGYHGNVIDPKTGGHVKPKGYCKNKTDCQKAMRAYISAIQADTPPPASPARPASVRSSAPPTPVHQPTYYEQPAPAQYAPAPVHQVQAQYAPSPTRTMAPAALYQKAVALPEGSAAQTRLLKMWITKVGINEVVDVASSLPDGCFVQNFLLENCDSAAPEAPAPAPWASEHSHSTVASEQDDEEEGDYDADAARAARRKARKAARSRDRSDKSKSE